MFTNDNFFSEKTAASIVAPITQQLPNVEDYFASNAPTTVSNIPSDYNQTIPDRYQSSLTQGVTQDEDPIPDRADYPVGTKTANIIKIASTLGLDKDTTLYVLNKCAGLDVDDPRITKDRRAPGSTVLASTINDLSRATETAAYSSGMPFEDYAQSDPKVTADHRTATNQAAGIDPNIGMVPNEGHPVTRNDFDLLIPKYRR